MKKNHLPVGREMNDLVSSLPDHPRRSATRYTGGNIDARIYPKTDEMENAISILTLMINHCRTRSCPESGS